MGRSEELAMLGEACAQAREGSPAAVLIGGEAGVGKSRLVDEFTGGLPGGTLVLLGGCVELGTNGLAFAPFTAVLRALVRELGVAGVADVHGKVRELGRLLPVLGPPGDDDGLARARLFEEYLAVLADVAERRPVVLVIEDMHWADRSSRELLGFLVHNQHAMPGLLMVTTHRSDQLDRSHPLRRLLAELDRSAWVRRFELGRLSRAEVIGRLRGLLGREPDAELSEEIFRRSAGNPLFVEALSAGTGAPVPESIRDLLLAPLEHLPDGTRRVVRAAAVGGVRVGHALLSAVTGLGDAALADVLRPVVASNLLRVEEDGYVFHHALIREVLYDDLLPGERTSLHVRYADVLDSGGGAAVESAYHWYAAKRRPGKALAASWRAAAETSASLAHAEQMQMLLQVLELWDLVPDAAERIATSRADVVERAVRAGMAAGAGARSMDLVAGALAENRDPVRAGRLLACRGELRAALGQPGDLADLREAARLIPDGHELRASVLNTLAGRLLAVPREEEGRTVARAAVAAAGDPESKIIAAINLAYAQARAGDVDGQLPHLVAARTMAGRIGDHGALMHACRCEADVLQGAGRYEPAAAAARHGLRAAAEAGLARTSGPVHAGNLAEALIALGRWDEATETIDHALGQSPPPNPHAYLLVLRGTIALARGDLDRARTCARYAREVFTGGTSYAQDHLLLVRLEIDLRLAQDRRPDAVRLAERALSGDEIEPSPRYLWPVIEAGARAGATGLDGKAAALPVVGPVQHAHRLAFTAETASLGQWDGVAAAWGDLHQPYPQAWALLRAAEAAAEAGDRALTRSHLSRAAAHADRLAAHPLRTRIDRLARLSRVSLTPAGGSPADAAQEGFGLTPRERDVLDLIADGRTNRQIAAELFISIKTAGNHVSSILAKLGAAGRVQAAAIAHRHRLIRTDGDAR
ncbi:helix-turn-helix transcriptional regulator [Actinomadura darangshiensis]|uniref:Helix-turn-helix transcriptional regulator n=1 Tax=Actinomadura darangshiensis TaxID=705336 RepID=A0A4V2YUG2_9ACTN|nr:helix-turn-helix transcriptional regulator [Actinomadura darangshiensis]TDD77687.1 helix-turn-helix transcriptional regulator [Actinomadura darangshiensis]